MCYSLDSIFCKQLRKLSFLNDIHILVYYLQSTIQPTYILYALAYKYFKHRHLFSLTTTSCCVTCVTSDDFNSLARFSKVKFCEVLGLWITNPYCQHCTLLEELYQLNIPWKQVKYNTSHNAYQAVSRVLHEFVTCVTRVN